MTEPMSFQWMLVKIRLRGTFSQKDIAEKLGISVQYLHDLEHGRRKPSVSVVNRICHYMGRGPRGRREWHMAGARAHGWEV